MPRLYEGLLLFVAGRFEFGGVLQLEFRISESPEQERHLVSK